MLTTVEGVFPDGRVELREAPPVDQARVIVTFLPEPPKSGAGSSQLASEANRRILALLQAWSAEPLSADEERFLDEFEAFQAQRPLRFATLQEEP